ncbi:hypothetical protein FS749_007665 [Ceratobasidium sp. UAMH 11750]|nr:hypothetical protein FS749_007665 [Ceratobasidium sp. UAMH 11750]
MTRYFIFQVVHGFLIVANSSGIIAALPGLPNNPGSIATILAQKLPEASTFFLTYAILQDLAGNAGGLLQAVPLVSYYVKLYILGSTPRPIYNIKYTLRNVAWGTLFPAMSLITVIGITYSIISPSIDSLERASHRTRRQLGLRVIRCGGRRGHGRLAAWADGDCAAKAHGSGADEGVEPGACASGGRGCGTAEDADYGYGGAPLESATHAAKGQDSLNG